MHNRIIFAVILVLSLAGCIVWDAGYTENNPVSQYSVAIMDRVPITYSISMNADREDVFGLPSVKSLRPKIESALRATGMFSTIQYGVKGGDDSYHIEFVFRQAGMSRDDSMAVGLLAGYTLLLVPTCEILTFDGSAILSLQGKAICSSAKAEELRFLIWAPMAPFGIFFNAWEAWDSAEEGVVNALCEDIAEEHKRRFLQHVQVQKIIKK